MSATAAPVNPVVADYVDERAGLINKIEMIQNLAKERGKDPSDDDLEVIQSAQARVRKLDNFIDVLGTDMTMDDDTQAKLRQVSPGSVPAIPKYRSAGELMADVVRANFGKQHDHDHRESRQRYDTLMKRAAQHMGTDATATVPVAGGFGGLFVDPVVGPIIDVSPKGQPFLTAIGKQRAPDSLSFLRPSISDPNFDTGASDQGQQKAELVSVKFDVTTESISLATVGGYLNVSQQLISLHPTGWDIILRQLQARVARQGELGAISKLSTDAVAVTLATSADAATTWAALVEGARRVAQATQMPAEWIAYGPLGWERLAKVVDTTGRPLFPSLGPVNAFGQASLGDDSVSASGLRPIYSTGITDIGIYIGNSNGFEAYSYPFPVLEAVEPSLLGRQVAVAEALAYYTPIANSVVKVAP